MNYFQKFFRHLKTVRTHRKWVRYYCRMLGMNWQGLTHDLSKYSTAEFWESVRWYQGTSSPLMLVAKRMAIRGLGCIIAGATFTITLLGGRIWIKVYRMGTPSEIDRM